MSLWNSIKEVPNAENQMKLYYDLKSLSEIRVKYAVWIEDYLRNVTFITEEAATQFYVHLRDFMTSSSNSKEFVLINTPIKDIPPMHLFTHLINGNARELQLIEEIPLIHERNQHEMIQRIIECCNEFYTIPNVLLDPVRHLTNIFQDYLMQEISVSNKLKNWRRKQIDVFYMDSEERKKFNQIQTLKLNKIQIYFEQLSEVTVRLSTIITDYLENRSGFLYDDESLKQLAGEILIRQQALINYSLVVDTQPYQVIKTNTCFSCSVRWLLGQQLGLKEVDLIVQCDVVSEAEAREININPQNATNLQTTTEIRCNKAPLQYQEQDRVHSAYFKNLQFGKIQRAGRRGSSDSVMDEKLALLFRMKVKINNTLYTISTLSLPVVIIVHGNQEYQAMATIMWDNAFSEVERDLFQVPDKVFWTKLTDALSLKCFSETNRGFTEANIHYLYEKFFLNMMMTKPLEEITWQKFCKDTLPGLSFTFWDWFYQTIKLIKEHLLSPWNANFIEGFISRRTAEKNLENCKPGTFLLRFSESVKGAVTVSYINEKFNVVHIQPFTMKDLRDKCIADRISECINIGELFPYGIEKAELINGFGTLANTATVSGYVAALTVTMVDPDA